MQNLIAADIVRELWLTVTDHPLPLTLIYLFQNTCSEQIIGIVSLQVVDQPNMELMVLLCLPQNDVFFELIL